MIAGFIAPVARITSHRADTRTSCVLTTGSEIVAAKTGPYMSSR